MRDGTRGQRGGDSRRGRGQQADERTPEQQEFEEQVIQVNRVMRVRKGGRKQRFNALTVVGNRKGTVGVGFGKANEVPEAIRKSLESARKNLFSVPLVGGTIPHEIVGESGSSRILLRPASPGTGVVAGGATRLILEVAGVRDVLGKSLGSSNKVNNAAATIAGLKALRSAAQLAALRGKELMDIFR